MKSRVWHKFHDQFSHWKKVTKTRENVCIEYVYRLFKVLKVMSANDDACTIPPDHRMAHTSHYFEVWAKTLGFLFDLSPQLEKIARMPCEYAILQESPKKNIARLHVAGPCQPLHGTTPPSSLVGVGSRIKILADDERIMGWCGVVREVYDQHWTLWYTTACLRRVYTEDNITRTSTSFRR